MSEQCCENGVVGYGNRESGIVLVGIAPGKDEFTRTHRPMTGPTGKLLDNVLEACGWSRAQCFATNICCQWEDEPSDEQLMRCKPRLMRELEGAKLVVTLGKRPCEWLLGLSFGKARGAIVPFNTGHALATFHPAAILHERNPNIQNNLAAFLVRDISKIVQIVSGEIRGTYSAPPDFTLVTSSIEAQRVLNSLPTDRPVTLDIETNYDKDADKAESFDERILCVGVRVDGKSWVFTEQALDGLVWPSEVLWCGHNIYGFDAVALRQHFGCVLNIVEDTMLQSYTLDERAVKGLHKLKPLAREYIGSDFYEEDAHKPDTPEGLQALYSYNAQDIFYTDELRVYFHKKQVEDNVRDVYEKLLIPGANLLSECQYEGVPVDLVAMRDVMVEFNGILKDTKRKLLGYANELGFDGDFKPGSWRDVSKMLYQVIGLPGGPSTAKEILQDLEHSFVDDLMVYRMLDKLWTSYLINPLLHLKSDNRVHPKASFLVGTGRLSYSDPPIQTIPKRHTIGEYSRLRKMFCAEPGYVLLEADFKQIELWLAYGFSHDTLMGEDLAKDMHGVVAETMLHTQKTGHVKGCVCDDCGAWDFARYAAKHINFSMLYRGANSLTRKPPIGANLTKSEAQHYRDAWYKRYTTFAQWQLSIDKQIFDNGEIVTPFGRKKRFPIALNQRQLRQGVNAPIQSTGSDYTLSSAIELRLLLKPLDSRIMFLVHDSCVLHVKEKNLEAVKRLVREVMTKPRLADFPSIAVELSVGTNLYDMSEEK